MPETPKVAIVTGASHGIGAGLAAGFRGAGYAVVGVSRSILPSDEPDLLTVQGDIARTETAVNLAGFFHMTQRALAQMVIQGSGHIVNITTSLLNHADSTRPSALVALTNGGLDAATRSLAAAGAARTRTEYRGFDGIMVATRRRVYVRS
jgi:NAD(P)-dependent dehydrogenase (short-subunit alcohol dehydrogenase family)